jgi:protocatechuate 3,4-dioxygenase beta subunit
LAHPSASLFDPSRARGPRWRDDEAGPICRGDDRQRRTALDDAPDSAPRRRLLRLLALTPLGGLAVPARAERAAARAGLIAPSVCMITPRATEGPFYLDERLRRADITEGRPGAPVDLAIQVVDAACRPLPGARIDVWHCDAAGDYSGFADQGDEDTEGETFLRGTQISDAQGVVRFRTIWPGWYPGRTPHYHYMVLLDGGRVLTSQIFLPDPVSERIYADLPAYARPRPRRVFNRNDRIALEAGDGAFATVRKRGPRREVALVAAVAGR